MVRSIRTTLSSLLILLWTSVVFAAGPTVRVATNKDGTGGGSTSLAFNAFVSDPVTGDTIVVMQTTAGTGTGGTAQAPTDTAGNTYSQIGTDQCGTWNSSTCISMWYAWNITGGSSFVITTHWSASPTWYGQIAWVLTGTKTTGTPYNGDFVKGADSAVSASSLTTSVAPSANSLAVGGISSNCGSNTVVNGAGWTTPALGSVTSNSNQDLYGEYNTVSGTYTADWTSGSCSHIMLTASFGPPAAASSFPAMVGIIP